MAGTDQAKATARNTIDEIISQVWFAGVAGRPAVPSHSAKFTVLTPLFLK